MLRILCTTAVCVSAGCLLAAVVKPDAISARAKKLHFSSIVVDTHDDTTQRFLDGKFDLGARHTDGSIDIPRMREGGLHAIFFSIWIPSKITGQEAVNRALAQIAAVREQVRAHQSEEHTSELQSQSNLVCRLLLEKKKKYSKSNKL